MEIHPEFMNNTDPLYLSSHAAKKYTAKWPVIFSEEYSPAGCEGWQSTSPSNRPTWTPSSGGLPTYDSLRTVSWCNCSCTHTPASSNEPWYTGTITNDIWINTTTTFGVADNNRQMKEWLMLLVMPHWKNWEFPGCDNLSTRPQTYERQELLDPIWKQARVRKNRWWVGSRRCLALQKGSKLTNKLKAIKKKYSGVACLRIKNKWMIFRIKMSLHSLDTEPDTSSKRFC